LDQYADDSYYTLAFLYCAARREVAEGKSGEFEAAYKLVSERSEETEELMGYHIDALRVFVLMKRQRVSVARDTAAKWRNSVAARQFVPSFWRTFPDGAEIIKTWNQLLGEQALAFNAPFDVADEVNQASGVACRNQRASRDGR
jgi:hypothetical protein